MADKGKTDLSIQAMNSYNDKMAESQSNIENAIDNTTTNTTTDSTAKSDNLNAVETTIENAQTNSIEFLKNIEKKLSGNVKETVAQVIEMQTRKKAAIEAVIKTRQEAAQYVTAVKDAKKALEQAQKFGDTQAIQTSENTLKQAQDALNTENQKLSQSIESKKEAMKGGVGQLKKQARQAGNNQTNSTANSTGTTTQTDNSTAPITTTSTNTITATNTSSTTTDNTTVTNNTNTDTIVYKNKGQEIKAQKANSASHGSNSKDQ
ncbi:hypothetical protein [Clostridium thailandense]|uniref:hypothetical protein n=1 Tax=Clostridium thailandense TaxID=2794346 RepID=UPI0039893383